MINIITKPSDKATINDFEAFFNSYVLAKDFDNMSLEAMKIIDGAELLDKNLGTVKTKFGVSDVLHLSTGCKVVLSYLYIFNIAHEYSDRILNVTECGSNALEVLFNFADMLSDNKTTFLLRHINQLLKCKDRQYCINGNVVNSLYEGVVLYG